MKFGEWGKFPWCRGRVRTSQYSGMALSSKRLYLMHILNRSSNILKNIYISNAVQIGFLICTGWLPIPKDRELWARYRSGAR